MGDVNNLNKLLSEGGKISSSEIVAIMNKSSLNR